jgi:hypothetical protein
MSWRGGGRGLLAGEDEQAEGAEAEHVEQGGTGVGLGELGGPVQSGVVAGEGLDVGRAGERGAGRLAAGHPGTGVPVRDPGLEAAVVPLVDQHRRGAQGPVEHAPGVGEAEGFDHLSEQVEAVVHLEGGAPPRIGEPPVEANLGRVVLEEQRRAPLVLGHVDRTDDARVIEGAEQLELPLGGPGGGLSAFGVGVVLEGVDPDAALELEAGVAAEEVLVGNAGVGVGLDVGEQVDEAVVADLAAVGALPDADLTDGVGDPLAEGAVDPSLGPAVRAGSDGGDRLDQATDLGPLRRELVTGVGIPSVHLEAAGR